LKDGKLLSDVVFIDKRYLDKHILTASINCMRIGIHYTIFLTLFSSGFNY